MTVSGKVYILLARRLKSIGEIERMDESLSVNLCLNYEYIEARFACSDEKFDTFTGFSLVNRGCNQLALYYLSPDRMKCGGHYQHFINLYPFRRNIHTLYLSDRTNDFEIPEGKLKIFEIIDRGARLKVLEGL